MTNIHTNKHSPREKRLNLKCFLTFAELKAEKPAAPLVLAVAPVTRMVPSPLCVIRDPASRINKKAERAAISQIWKKKLFKQDAVF